MTRTPLRSLDPVALARDTVQEAIDRVHSLAQAIHVAITCGIDLDVPNEATTLGHAVQCLTRYAQTGAPLDARDKGGHVSPTLSLLPQSD